MLVFSLLAVFAFLAGGMILVSAQSAIHEIEAGVCFLMGAIFSVGALLATINEKFGRLLASLTDLRDELRQRQDSAGGVTTERWETLATSLDRLERGVAATRRFSNFDDDFEPTPAYVATTPPTEVKARCPKCARTVKGKADWAGRKAKCPSCGGDIEFPHAPTIFDGVV